MGVLGKSDLSWFNENARDAVIINQQILTQQNLLFLDMLPQKIVENNLLFVHGSPRDNIYEYLFTIQLLRTNIKLFEQQVCFCGHTHIPLVYLFNFLSGKEDIKTPRDNNYIIELQNDTKYIINVGSVGQPRDGNPKSCYVIFDTDKKTVEYKRVEYNISVVQQKMKMLNIPEFLITRLEFGE
jgi:diadenosine tetraphosphatase ApaH/serine/threonine PP2A family protein phosphatase